MLFHILQYLKGYLRIRVTGYSVERFLNACRHREIRLWDVRPCEDSYEMNIPIQGFRQIRPIVRKTGTKAVIIQRVGFPFFIYRYRRRKIFFVSLAAFFLILYLLSGFIWEIDIHGNLAKTDEMLLSFLSTKEIRSGMRISKVDCSRIVKDIRKEFDDIIWVSASVEGTKLVIQVKENRKKLPDTQSPEEASVPVDIIADADCTVRKIVTRKGIPLVEAGSQVQKGQILVSGQIPVRNDAGEIVAYQHEQSDADILGETGISYHDEQPVKWTEKIYDKSKKQSFYIKFGDFRLTFGWIPRENKSAELYCSEKTVELFPGFYLPVVFGNYTRISYEEAEKTYRQDEIQKLLSRRFYRYCMDLEKKGVEIIRNDVKIYTGLENAQAKGTLTVTCPVGEKKNSAPLIIPEQTEQVGEE